MQKEFGGREGGGGGEDLLCIHTTRSTAHHAEETGFGLQTFITVCPGRGTEARRHTSTHSSRHTQALNHERCNGRGEGGRVSLSPFVQGGGILGGMGGVRGVAAG